MGELKRESERSVAGRPGSGDDAPPPLPNAEVRLTSSVYLAAAKCWLLAMINHVNAMFAGPCKEKLDFGCDESLTE